MAASMPIGAALIGIDQSATVRSIATPRPLACQAMITAPIAMTASLIATRMDATNIREHGRAHGPGKTAGLGPPRSEEHTSELQSLMRISYAVFCLKKKKQTNTTK